MSLNPGSLSWELSLKCLFLRRRWPSCGHMWELQRELETQLRPHRLVDGLGLHLFQQTKVRAKASLVAQSVKNLPAVQETRVWSLGWENPLEKETATHSSILAWKISEREAPGELQSMGSQRVGHDWATNTYLKWESELKHLQPSNVKM